MTFDEDYLWSQPQPTPPAQPPRQAQRPSLSPWLTPLVTFLVLCSLLILGVLLWSEYRAYREAEARNVYGVPRAVEPRGELSEIEKSNIAIYKKAKPSVVHITSVGLERDFWSMSIQEVPEGMGSGFVWDEGGHIVTNYHVVKESSAYV